MPKAIASTQTVPTQVIVLDSDTVYTIDQPGHYVFELVKPKTEIKIISAMKATGNAVIELDVLIKHLAPEIHAQAILKAVGFDHSRIILRAKILIEKGCQKTESFLTERVLLVSEHARALAIPDLEILTDDVRCSHAASISKIPEEQIFYLTSRGLARRAAEEMIVKGFLKNTALSD